MLSIIVISLKNDTQINDIVFALGINDYFLAKGLSMIWAIQRLKWILATGLLSMTVFAVAGEGASAKVSVMPGAKPFNQPLATQLLAMKAKRGPSYQPRTRHLNPDGSAKYTNRLFLQSSLYLLQHAHNPVNWYPWGDEAFAAAKKRNLPVLLSIGYSTCHWCHVMEEESFEDPKIAQYLNENYIAIKVDREEHPDVDSTYMAAVQAMTGSGGWPMTSWLTPDKKPFYGGTYFPPYDGDRGVQLGLYTLLQRFSTIYHSKPDKVAQQSQMLVDYIKDLSAPGELSKNLPDATALKNAFYRYSAKFDATDGGMSQVPKFPGNLPTRFLLRYFHRSGDKKALDMATLSLKKMASGGIYDHIGGGFHRYSTDGRWLVPHFEKMLYDNALMAMAYLEGYQATGEPDFLRVTNEILRYVQRDMTSKNGGFYSATDADSLISGNQESGSQESQEGYYFTWTAKELDQLLPKETAKIVKAYYAVTEAGNFEGRNILHTPKDAAAVAQQLQISEDTLRTVVNDAKAILYQARERKPLPLRDEKIITAWNGLMISAFARAGLMLDDQDYINQAVKAASFIKNNMVNQGRLFRSYQQGLAKHDGYLTDYTFYIAGLLDLYEA
ncbi:MAG: hypothetical protein ACI8WB_005717, partial [Phenylobacterium sp.]